jgi:AcrR family transcriptional regulator
MMELFDTDEGCPMETCKLSRREREKLRQRQEVFDVALRLFSEKGYHNVSMHEIAKEAEFAIGTLYKFFRNKEDLYKAIILQLSDRFHGALTEVIEGEAQEIEKLRAYIRVKGELFRNNVAAIRLYFAEARGASFNLMAGLDQEIRERRGSILLSLASIFERGMNQKRFRRVAAPFHLAIALDSMATAIFFHCLEDPQGHPYPEEPDTILNILFKELVNPLRSP